MKLVRLLMDGGHPFRVMHPFELPCENFWLRGYRRSSSMGSLKNRLSKFANSSKGRKLREKAMRKAKDPKVRAKIAKKFGKKG